MEIPRSLPARLSLLLLGASALFCWGQTASAAVVISFNTDGPAFEGDTAGTTAGPFTDLVSGVSGTITHTSITKSTGAAGGVLDFGSTQNGIDNTGISGQESWSFEWDVNAQFLGIDFSAVGSGFNVRIQSNAWIGASITPGSNVSFSSETGTFLYNGDQAGDTFNQANMYGVGAVPIIAAGTDITITTVDLGGGTFSSYSLGNDFTWNLIAVPEPGSGALIAGMLGVGLSLRRRRR